MKHKRRAHLLKDDRLTGENKMCLLRSVMSQKKSTESCTISAQKQPIDFRKMLICSLSFLLCLAFVTIFFFFFFVFVFRSQITICLRFVSLFDLTFHFFCTHNAIYLSIFVSCFVSSLFLFLHCSLFASLVF